MQQWQNIYKQTVILTRGEHGCSYLNPINGELCTIPAIPVQVVDTTGAGDAFNAALCYGFSTGLTLEQTIQFAVKAASLSVTKFGAQNGMPTYMELSNA
jgi:ribokinase